MAINLKSTGSVASGGIKVLVYGQAGAGKTHLISLVFHRAKQLADARKNARLRIGPNTLERLPAIHDDIQESYSGYILHKR